MTGLALAAIVSAVIAATSLAPIQILDRLDRKTVVGRIVSWALGLCSVIILIACCIALVVICYATGLAMRHL